jgi:predicted phage terminase large subunit-like protein
MGEIGKTVLLDDGDPIWPEEFTNETIEEIAVEQGPVNFARQWLNIKMLSEDQRFLPEDFRYYKLSPDGDYVIYDKEHLEDGKRISEPTKVAVKDLYRTMVIDPGTGEHKKTDDSAISVVGYDRETGNIFVLEEWAKKVQPHRLIQQILHFADKWKPAFIAPEEAAFQSVLKQFLKQAMQETKIMFPIRPVKPGNIRKITRIDGLQPFVRNNQLYVRREHKKLIDELCNLQVVRGKLISKSPNRADALAYHVDFWKDRKFDRGIKPEIPYRTKKRKTIRSYGLECET